MSALWLRISGFLAPLLLVALAWWRGRSSAKQAAAAAKEAEYADTRRRMDAAAEAGNDPDAARRWLRERAANQP